MGIDFAYLRRIISVSANTELLNFVLEDWVKEDKRYFFQIYTPNLIYKACYFLYKNIAKAIIEQVDKDLVVVHDADYIDSTIDTYFNGFPDIKDAIVRKQLSEYISAGAKILFTKNNPWEGYGYFPNYLDQELKKNRILKNDETCIFVFGHTRNPKYAKKTNYYNLTYFLTNVFNIEILNLLVDYRSWMKAQILKNDQLHYCFTNYYKEDYSENEKKKIWNDITSSEEKKDKFIQSYIENYIIYAQNKEYHELLFEYDNRAEIFLGKDIFTNCCEKQENENEYDTGEYNNDYEYWYDNEEY